MCSTGFLEKKKKKKNHKWGEINKFTFVCLFFHSSVHVHHIYIQCNTCTCTINRTCNACTVCIYYNSQHVQSNMDKYYIQCTFVCLLIGISNIYMYMLRESDGDAYDCLHHRYNNTKRFFKGRSREVRRGNRESKT